MLLMRLHKKDFFHRWLLLSMFSCSIFSGCNKPSAVEFDSDFLRNVENISVKDTTIFLEVKDSILADPSLMLISPATYYAPLGNFHTAEFGTIKSDIFFEVKPSFPLTFAPSTAVNLRLDSAFLSLRYGGAMEGDSIFPTKIDVYPITDNRFLYGTDKIYHYGNNIVYNKNLLLGTYSKNLPELRRDSLRDAFTYHSNVMRIPLDKKWASSFLTQTHTTGYASDSAYMSFFKGFALIADKNVNASVRYFNLTDTSTRLVLYFSYDSSSSNPKRINAQHRFRYLSGNCAFATEVERDRSNSRAGLALQNEQNNEEIFLQPSPNASSVLIRLPEVSFLKNCVINRAEVIMEEKDLPFNRFKSYIRPKQLYLDIFPQDSNTYYPLPVGLSGTDYTFFPSDVALSSYLEAVYQSTTDFKGYKINISRYLQRIARGKASQPRRAKIWMPYIITYNISPSRRVSYRLTDNNALAQSGIYLYGQQAGNPKSIRLRITYTVN